MLGPGVFSFSTFCFLPLKEIVSQGMANYNIGFNYALFFRNDCLIEYQ